MTDAPVALPSDYAERLSALPANSWTFRRIFIFAATALLLALEWRMVELMPPADLAGVAKWHVALIGLLAFLYLVGPTAEHVVRLGSLVQSFWPLGSKTV